MALLTNEAVLEESVRDCRGMLVRTAFRVVRDAEVAEDVVQDALLSATRNLEQFRGESKMSTWLCRIVINNALMHKRRPVPPLTSFEEPIAEGVTIEDSLISPLRNPEQQYGHDERAHIANDAALRLSPKLRRAFVLFDIQGYEIRQASKMLGIPVGTFKSRLCRARKEIRETVERHETRADA